MDHYEVLGLTTGNKPNFKATPKEISRAYKKLALKWHPDRNPSKEAQAQFQLVNEANLVLSDPEKKRLYDETLNPSTHVFSTPAFNHPSSHPFNDFSQQSFAFEGSNPFANHFYKNSAHTFNTSSYFSKHNASEPFNNFFASNNTNFGFNSSPFFADTFNPFNNKTFSRSNIRVNSSFAANKHKSDYQIALKKLSAENQRKLVQFDSKQTIPIGYINNDTLDKIFKDPSCLKALSDQIVNLSDLTSNSTQMFEKVEWIYSIIKMNPALDTLKKELASLFNSYSPIKATREDLLEKLVPLSPEAVKAIKTKALDLSFILKDCPSSKLDFITSLSWINAKFPISHSYLMHFSDELLDKITQPTYAKALSTLIIRGYGYRPYYGCHPTILLPDSIKQLGPNRLYTPMPESVYVDIVLNKHYFSEAVDKVKAQALRLNSRAKKNSGYKKAVEAANTLVAELKQAQATFCKSNDPIKAEKIFVDDCKDAIIKAQLILAKHRGWSQVLLDIVNVILSIATAGILNIVTQRLRLFSVETESVAQLKHLKCRLTEIHNEHQHNKLTPSSSYLG